MDTPPSESPQEADLLLSALDASNPWQQPNLNAEHAALLNALAKDSPLGIAFLAWPDFLYAYANAALAEINGLTIADMIGRSPTEVLGEELPGKLDGFCQHAMATRQAILGVEVEAEIRGKPGERRCYAINYQPVFTAQGEPSGVWVVVQDTTDRAEARQSLENALRESQEQSARLKKLAGELARERAEYRTLTEAVPQFVWSTDETGAATYFNARWEAFTGTPTAQLLGYGWQHDVHPDDLPLTHAAWQAAVQQGAAYEVEYRLRGRDGIYRYFLARGTPVRNPQGETLQFVGTTTDITPTVLAREGDRVLRQIGEEVRARLDSEETLRVVAEHLGRYLRASRVYYADVDENARTVRIHSDYRRDAGLPQIAGIVPLHIAPSVLEDYHTGRTLAFADLAEDPRTRSFYAVNFAPGHIRSMLTVPLREHGKWVSTLVVAESEPRAWTEEEAQTVEAAATQIRLAVENARLYQAERERARRLEEAFGDTHHRVKNSLQKIISLMDMRIMDDAETPITRVDFQRVMGQVRAIAVVHEYLSSQQAAMTVPVREVLQRLVPMAAREAGLRATWEADSVALTIEQATAVALILNELLGNARKHGAGKAAVRLSCSDNACLLTVADDGPGFPDDFQPHKHARQGLTLLLNQAERDLRGRVVFHNEPSGGSRVEVRFPLR